MDQINAVVDCDVSRLDFPLRAWKARQGHNFVALFRRVPADVTGLFVRVFKANDAYFDVTGHEHPDGGWTVRVPAACFPYAGEFRYAVGVIEKRTEEVVSIPHCNTLSPTLDMLIIAVPSSWNLC